MPNIRRHPRLEVDPAKERRLDKLFAEIEKSRTKCGCGCRNYHIEDGYCSFLGRGVIEGSDCETPSITREASRG